MTRHVHAHARRALGAIMTLVAACDAPATSPPPAIDMTVLPDLAPTGDLLPPPIGPPGRTDEAPNIDGVDRTYIRDVPPSAIAAMATGPVPLLIALHGAGDTSDHFYSSVGFPQLASKHAFVVAVPQGYRNGWFIQQSEGWPGDDGQTSGLQNDAHLMLQIIADTASLYFIDARRIYLVGFSRGAAMTGILAGGSNNPKVLGGKFSSPFAAYALTSGYDAFSGNVDFSLSGPKRPIWILHGDADRVVVFSSGQQFSDELTGAGWPVTFTEVTGAPHDWLWQARYGQTNEDLWNFFAMNPLP
jgi:poly(3-hydroxybutyrate) depolymerase